MVEDTHLIDLVGITKEFGDTKALDNVNLYIRKREFITLLGPSGCGKTTMLRIIGGFEYPDEGQVLFEGKDIANVPPYKRRVNTVFQKYALFPHLNVFDNIAFGLRLKKIPKDQIAERVKRMLKLVNLEGFEKRAVDQHVRPAAAHRNRPRAGERAGGAAGRTAGRARPEAAQGDADGAQGDAAEAGHNLHIRHPRPGRRRSQ